MLKLVASRLSSSSPLTSIRSERSCVSVTRSTVSVRRLTGVSAARATTRPRPGRDDDAPRRDEQEEQAQPLERLVDLGEGSRHLDGCIRAVAEGEDAEVRAVDLDVVPEGAALPPRDGEHVVVDRKANLLAERRDDAAVGVHELHVAARLAELGPYGEEVFALHGGDDRERMRGDLPGSLLEPVVHRRAQLATRDDVDDDRREDDGEGDGDGSRDGDPCPEAHVPHRSRSAYPTPRTVWIRRGASPASVLRRR